MDVYRFVERFAAAMVESGLPRMPARIFTALLCTDKDSLTATELADGLRASAAAVSSGVRYLMNVGMVNREGEPGSRQHHYRVPDNVWDQMFAIENRQLVRWAHMLHEGVELTGADSPSGRRMAEAADYMEFIGSELTAMMKRWNEHRATRKAGAVRAAGAQ